MENLHNGWISIHISETEITLKMPELNVTAHISMPFHVITKKSSFNEIFG